MARKRKTINVLKVLEKANHYLRHSQARSPEGVAEMEARRRGVASLLEGVLWETGNYEGFNYLSEGEVPTGELPGIVRNETYPHEFPDESRRVYFRARNLK